MGIINWVKGVFRKMFSPRDIEAVLHVTPTISTKMRDSIILWESLYKNEAPWLHEDDKTRVVSLGIAAMVASEKARTATIEMEAKITGNSERAKYIKTQFKKVVDTIRNNLEYGIALGGLVVKPYVTMGVNNKLKIEVNYIKASDFCPLSISSDGSITEAAFVDRVIIKDKVYSKLEHHKLSGTTLTITNFAFESPAGLNTNIPNVIANGQLGNRIALTDVYEWANVPESITIENIDEPLFAYFKMPQANTVDLNSALGVSGFSRAVDLIRDADEQYSALLWEFEGGQMAVDVDITAINPSKSDSGNPRDILPKLQRRLYRANLDLGADEAYHVFNPQLRDASYINGLNMILMKIEDACDLSRGTLSSVTYAEARTATELRILKQRSFSANADIQKELQRVLEHVIRIMDKYCDLYDIVPSGTYEFAFKWDDSIIVDKDTERQVDMMDVNNKLLSRVEYRMKWYGETEQQALEALKKLDEDDKERMQLQQSIMAQDMNNNTMNNNTPSNKGTAQKEQDKRAKANESGKIV
jgi:A118 family predicted phage portal protein